jgi:heme/copper-type cytochrome/quinol oxidase subunit 2
LLEGTVMLLGTTFTLASFHFSASRAPDGTVKRNRIIEIIAWIGRILIAITLGVLFAGVYMAALTAMIERLSSIINFIRQLIGL